MTPTGDDGRGPKAGLAFPMIRDTRYPSVEFPIERAGRTKGS
jgi:hypothetical protein